MAVVLASTSGKAKPFVIRPAKGAARICSKGEYNSLDKISRHEILCFVRRPPSDTHDITVLHLKPLTPLLSIFPGQV